MSRKFFLLLLLGMLTVGAAGMSLSANDGCVPAGDCAAPAPCDGCAPAPAGCDGCGGCPAPCDECDECDDDCDDDCDD